MILQMRTIGIGLLLAVSMLTPAVVKAGPATLTLDHKSIDATGQVTVTFDHSPKGDRQWIGLFPATPLTDVRDVSSYLDWQWTIGGQTAPGAAASGKLTFPTQGQQLHAGQYVFRFISGGAVVAESVVLTVTPSELPALALDHETAKPTGPVKVTFSYGPGAVGDWIGLFPATGLTDVREVSSYVDWQWVTGGRTPAGTATGGTLTFPTGHQQLPEGQYVFRLVSGGGVIAQSELLTLTNSSGDGPGLYLNRYQGQPTDPITVQFSHGHKGNREWIGIFPMTADITDISSYLDWQWVTGGRITIGFDDNGTLTFPTNGKLPQGQFVFRWVSNGKVVAQSAPLTIGNY